MIVIHTAQVRRLSRDISRSGAAAPAEARTVMAKAGVNMKAAGRRDAQHVQGGRIAAAWSYDIKATGRTIMVEAGAEKGHAGSLAFFYWGNSKIGPRIPDPAHIADDEAVNVERYLSQAVERTFLR